MKARFRDRRSSFAMTSFALRLRQRASASLSCGQSLRFPVSIISGLVGGGVLGQIVTALLPAIVAKNAGVA
jgi:hypothetical protein